MDLFQTVFTYANPAKTLIRELSRAPIFSTINVSALRDFDLNSPPSDRSLVVQTLSTTTTQQPKQDVTAIFLAFGKTYDEAWDVVSATVSTLSTIWTQNNPIVYVNLDEPFAEVEVEQGYVIAQASATITFLPDSKETVKIT